MSTPLGGARSNGGAGADRALAVQVKMLRNAVRENSSRIGRLERWQHWATGFMSANILIAVFNLVRGFLPDGGP